MLTREDTRMSSSNSSKQKDKRRATKRAVRVPLNPDADHAKRDAMRAGRRCYKLGKGVE